MNTMETDVKNSEVTIPLKIKSRLFPVMEIVFSETDFNKVRITDIAKMAGMSLATVYRYFDSKEDMIVALTEEHLNEIEFRVHEYSRGIGNAKELFRRRLWVIFDYYDEHPRTAVICLIMLPVYKWVEMNYYQLPEKGFAELCEAIKSDETLDNSIDVHIIKDMGYMILNRVVQLWYYKGKNSKMTAIFDEKFDYFWKVFLKSEKV